MNAVSAENDAEIPANLALGRGHGRPFAYAVPGARALTAAYPVRSNPKEASAGAASETLKGTVVGGLFGAAAGAAIGAAVGDPATGAALGAATGGMGGAAHNGYSAEDQYKRAYKNCLRNRRHNVIN